MQYTLALLGLAASAMAKPMPQAVTSAITPSAAAPGGCQLTAPGSYMITTVNVTTSSSKRDLLKRQTSGLTITLNNGVMLDQSGDTGYIAANRQFQFDKPPQAGAIYTAGFSLCPNNTIALGGSTIFYSCLSGSFSNLYDQSQGKQCSQVFISASPAGGSSVSSGGVTQTSDAQPQGATSAGASSAVSQLSDQQPQAATSAGASSAVSQISDMQPQAATSAGASSAVSQISDMQPQAPTSVAGVSQISDMQPQAATSAAASSPVTQISDMQPQAPTSAAVSQISDMQPQAPTSAANYTAAATPAAYTGAAVVNKPEALALAAGAIALLF